MSRLFVEKYDQKLIADPVMLHNIIKRICRMDRGTKPINLTVKNKPIGQSRTSKIIDDRSLVLMLSLILDGGAHDGFRASTHPTNQDNPQAKGLWPA